MQDKGWQFWIDRGGTFTDVIGRNPEGSLHSLKLLSVNPGQYADAAAEGIYRVLSAHDEGAKVDEIRMGTTVATNALLEQSGAATGLLITKGFGDALRIGYQNRPDIFALNIRRPEPLYTQVAEADERVDANGRTLITLDEGEVRASFHAWREQGIEAVAICFMHAWRNPIHEQLAMRIAEETGFAQVSASHEVSPLVKIISRASTTVADAYLSPVLSNYVQSFQSALAEHGISCPQILFMQSNGGLVSADRLRGKDSILSGPAGGVVGMAAAGQEAGFSRLIGFDMGGTSTDVSVYDGEAELSSETLVNGIYLRSPMIRIHTIAAGGGSILEFTSGRFQVGPRSAGADPGPMCYGRCGPLTVTDANLLLGRIQPDFFPHVFGPDADQPLYTECISKAFGELAASEDSAQKSPEHVAAGFLRIAVENMANALSHISIQRGLNPADYTLCCFGGAGGQHACQVADCLGIRQVLIDPLAGVLSAWGMGMAPLRSYRQSAVDQPLSQATLDVLGKKQSALLDNCRGELMKQGVTDDAITTNAWCELKVKGSDTTLTVQLGSTAQMQARFAGTHKARFGFLPDKPELIVESLRVEAESVSSAAQNHQHERQPTSAAEPVAKARLYTDERWTTVPVYARERLPGGTRLSGPAIISEAIGTTVLEKGWELEVNKSLQLVLTRGTQAARHEEVRLQADPIMLEVFSNQFMHVAEEMGAVLQNTASSVNIKERLDFSCAVFSAAGDLIANAPHIPVHLGSMDDSVKAVLAEHAGTLAEGDVFLTNAPYNGGTHLPDITAISPVVSESGQLLFVVAARAHHADIGGITPGSMPPRSSHIDEEGVLFDNFRVVGKTGFLVSELEDALTGASWPARNPAQNIADIKAQIAANERGRQMLLGMIERYGRETVAAYMEHVQDNAEESVRQVISKLGEGSFVYPFDNGQQISVTVSIDKDARSARIDFTGTSAAADNNLNAPASVCQAAVMYVFRTLVQSGIPLNAGCRRPLELVIPDGCMLNPQYPAAVVGGNVETSQCVVDALYGALGVLAASQGTMNNLSFGNDHYQYYETICGGAGASPDGDGADAVQTHMTNSRMTDPEVLEMRFPVLLKEFSIRKQSGGAGTYCGGDGAVRKLEFREAMSAAILSNHRKVEPFGIAGGENGSTGRNTILHHDDRAEVYDGIVEIDVAKGDVLVIETPGGGGYGTPHVKS
ncbi:MAG: 5-oxoprolinase [Chromatiales bacterium]|nr:5-oxoprolinase [Chromatiales bacterium]MDP7093573.1 hydantoinase B/oxoprolinase family protein [Gammaproteobacteria bacterium]HJP05227.1 hydantoinase B/oxoprolinase family protein [Gammaproteobacteria bacterium]